MTDLVAETKVVFRYRYAHGFYDGVEREFRGFARVDSWDADSMSADHGAGAPPGSLAETNGQYDLPPIHTITWFHTGAWNGERDDLRAALSAEFYSGDTSAAFLPPTAIPLTLLPPALREAYRSLKGHPLRQEIYAEDGTNAATAPYTVTEYRYEVEELQPIATQLHGVYHPFEREQIIFHYERNATDPRIEHKLSLETDSFGHIVREAHIAYARRNVLEPEQGQILATCGTINYATPIESPYDFRHGVVTESLHYELALLPTATPLTFAVVDTAMTGANVLPFDGAIAPGSMRTIGHVRHQFWKDDLSAPLAFGSVETRALVYDHFALALPATLLTSVFGANVTVNELTTKAGYVSPDGNLWTHAGTTTYDAAHFFQAITFTNPFGNVSSVVYDAERLFVIEEHTSATAAFDNVTTVTVDYRVLLPAMLTDPNGNRTALAFDPLGMVVATAVMGRVGANEGDTLADPTTKIEYDLLAWEAATPSPAYVHTYARMQHGPSNSGWFETYSYSDGFGHEVLKKAQAEPDTSGNPRWAGTGRTVFDNKGNPVKKYEPYFSADPGYDDEDSLVQTGYSDILRYDPLSRPIRVDHPDGTFETTEFDSWQEVRSDENDNVLESAWYADASSRPATDPLNRAAALAAEHAHTPAKSVVDPLGRTFLAIADNGPAGKYSTRTKLDIQGNGLAVTDALGNTTLRQIFDTGGHAIQHASLDAGTSLAIGDGVGHPYRAWDARGYVQRKVYDPLRRLTQVWITPPAGTEFLAEQIVYGEGLATPNFRGHLYQHFDGAGVLTNEAYDFEGHITHTTRRLAISYQTTPAWAALAALTDPATFLPAAQTANLLEIDIFDTWTAYDAMSRVVSVTTHDQTDVVLTYNAASLLGSVTAFMRGATTASPIVTNIDYNARGQRTNVSYGQGIATQYTYDDRTHMVMRVLTTNSGGTRLQDLNYTYDPVHNIVQIADLAQQTVYFAGNVTSGTQLFEYDAIYRLTNAQGREQPGQVGYAPGPNGYPEPPFTTIPHRNDLQALLAYTEDYSYDVVGNILATVHQAGNAGWTRTQTYVAGTNQLDRVSLPGDPAGGPYSGIHQHDATGNLSVMPHLPAIGWDQDCRMISASLQGGGKAYFTYDSKGERVRKIIEQGGRILERTYIGNYERYREHSGAPLDATTVTLERETVHIYDGHRRFAIVETKTIDTSVPNLTVTSLFRLQFPNHLGSACLETDESGTPISYEEYYPFGGSSFRAGDVDKRYRFSGKERDEETGLYYFGARYYAPWLARWTACDPAGFVDGTNLYSYVRNNPVRMTDPGGTQAQDETKSPVVGGEEAGTFTLPAVPQLKLDPPNFLSSSYSQSLGDISSGKRDVEANFYVSGSRSTGLGMPAQGGGGLQNAQLQLRQQFPALPGFDLGVAGGGSYTSQGTISGETTSRGLSAAGLAHYSSKGDSGFGVGGYLAVGAAGQRSSGGSWMFTPTAGFTGVLGYEPASDEPKPFTLADLAKPPDSPYKLGFQGIDLNPQFTYAGEGQLSQGPLLQNLYTLGGYAGVGINIGSQFVLLPEVGGFYSHGDATSPQAQQIGESGTWRAGVAGTFNWAGRGSNGPQTNSVSVGAWFSQERGKISGPAASGSPSGGFVTDSFMFGVTFGYRANSRF